MEPYLLAEDDGLPLRDSGPWTAEKLDYLNRYIRAFTISMRKRWPHMHYVDVFCGPGKCRIRDTNEILLGSPLLALTAPHPFTQYYFADLSQTYVEATRTRCEVSPRNSDVSYLVGDANELVRTIVKDIRDREQLTGASLNLAFLDPEGVELRWSTVEHLATVGRMDLIIYYPQQALSRIMGKLCDQTNDSSVDLFFGDRNWRDIYQEYAATKRTGRLIHHFLVDHYKAKLAALGYAEVKGSHELATAPLMKNSREAPLYRLLFASRHALGHKFWADIARRDVHGQLQMRLR